MSSGVTGPQWGGDLGEEGSGDRVVRRFGRGSPNPVDRVGRGDLGGVLLGCVNYSVGGVPLYPME